MNEPYQRYLKLGIVHFMAFPQTMKGDGPILETLATIATDADFEAIEVAWIRDDAVRAAARNLLAASGMDVYYGAHPRLLSQKLSLCDLDDARRGEAVVEMRSAIDEAVEIGARGLALLSGKDCAEPRRAESTERLVRSLQELCDYAGERNLPILLETFDRASYAKGCLIGPTVEAVAVAERVGRDNFGLLLDLSHMPLIEETAEQMLPAGRAHLRHIHIGNCVKRFPSHVAYGDEHPRFGIPEGENGVEQLKTFLRELFHVGYLSRSNSTRPVVSFEVKPMPGEPPEAVIAHSKRVFRQAWAELEI